MYNVAPFSMSNSRRLLERFNFSGHEEEEDEEEEDEEEEEEEEEEVKDEEEEEEEEEEEVGEEDLTRFDSIKYKSSDSSRRRKCTIES